MVMANITEYKIEFASSSNITIDQPSYATYEEYYLLNGKITKRDGTYYLIVIITVGLMIISTNKINILR